MKNKHTIHNSLLVLLLISTFAFAGCKQPTTTSAKWVEEALANAEKQALFMAHILEDRPDELPRSTNTKGELVTSGSDWWCSGFFPGVLWYLYEYSGNEEVKKQAAEFTNRVNKEQYNTSTHDLGFMIFCSYGNALRITGEDSCRNVILNGAASLSTRYSPNTGCIRSWDIWRGWTFPVIIDNMMNLEMLMWAYKNSGNEEYRDIAIAHADKTIQNHYREDNSSWHVVVYSPETGEIIFKGTDQGYSDESAWARGQAWGLYGYTMMYRETGDEKYLAQANLIARFILDHPNLPEDKIPYWDFDSPAIPDDMRDSSAAAVIAAALLELTGYVDEVAAKEYFSIAEQQLQTLASPEYTAEPCTNGGFILKHGVGNVPANSELDAPLTYGDYYYVEALMRYKEHLLRE